eukprot:TRINITY_DN8164_c0_g1_i1.p1 TRINITY_DN8164_c0_g1~~TRINITY_DN8164_c0_g1_i1.p1  ORF type:complete len:271 (+),score=66.13 TRINITY_DN8164_c0_g1_i1:1-813(+)
MMTAEQAILDFATKIAEEAGKFIQDAWGSRKDVQFKATTDLVTETDKKSEELIMSRIREKYPDHKFIAEETVSEGKGTEELTDAPTWIIDPLDGTINFVHGIPHVAVSIGFAVNREYIVGVIYNPILRQMYTGIRGQGAFLNGERISVGKKTDLKNALVAIACGAEISQAASEEFFRWLQAAISNCRTWRRHGSAALDMADVATGTTDVYIERGIHAWDIAAGTVIVREAGGVVRHVDDVTNFDACRRQVFCGNGSLVSLFAKACSLSQE